MARTAKLDNRRNGPELRTPRKGGGTTEVIACLDWASLGSGLDRDVQLGVVSRSGPS